MSEEGEIDESMRRTDSKRQKRDVRREKMSNYSRRENENSTKQLRAKTTAPQFFNSLLKLNMNFIKHTLQ